MHVAFVAALLLAFGEEFSADGAITLPLVLVNLACKDSCLCCFDEQVLFYSCIERLEGQGMWR